MSSHPFCRSYRTTSWLLRLSAVVVAAACNQPPNPATVTIEPATPTTTDDLVAVVGGDDPDGDKLSYTFTWSRDGVAVAGLTTDTVPASETAKGESWTVSVLPDDGKATGTAAEATVEVVNTPPSATLELTPLDATTEDDLVATAVGTDADGDTVTFTYVWTKDGASTSESADTVAAASTSRGETWSVTATPSDDEADGQAVTAEVTLINALPVISAVTLSPLPSYADGDLFASVEALDGDGDPITYTYAWTVNGVPAGTNSDTLPVGAYARGEVVICEVTPNDGVEDGAAVSSAPNTILNAPPTHTGVSLLPDPAYEASVLTCTPAGWYDGDDDPEAYQWSWTVNGTAIAATSQTLTGAAFNKADVLTCTAIADDGIELGTSWTSANLTVRNTTPVLASATLSSLNPLTTDTLSLTLGALTDADPADAGDLEVRYAWYVDGALAGTGATLPPTAFAKDQLVYAVVTPSDPEADGAAVTTATAQVGNATPVTTALVISPSAPFTTTTLTATPTSTDDDGDALTHTYVWTVDGAIVPGVSGPSLDGSNFVKDQVIGVTVTANDGFSSGAPFSAATVTVRNSAPTLAGAEVSPANPTESDVLTCVPLDWSDADDDLPAYIYTWTVNGTSAGTAATLDGSRFDKHDMVGCTVTPTDGTTEGAPRTAAAVEVLNTPPIIVGASIAQTEPREGDTLTILVDRVADIDPADADAISRRVEWRVNGVPVATSFTLGSELFNKGDVVEVELFPADPEEEGEGYTTGAVTVLNSLPVIQSVVITPNPAFADDTLLANLTASDADGDPISYTYQWRIEGAIEVDGDLTGMLGAPYLVHGESIYVIAFPHDGEADGVPVNSAAITIQNTPPSAPMVDVLPHFPMAGVQDLHCALLVESDDIDGDLVTYTVTWLRNGEPYAAGGDLLGPTSQDWPGDTVPGVDTSDGDVWTCEFRPADFADDGEVATLDRATYEHDLRSLSAGTDFTCGIRPNDLGTCWGLDEALGARIPAIPFREVSAGLTAGCGITTEDTIECWGGDLPQLRESPEASLYRGVQVGGIHACAIDADDAAVCWGVNIGGATDAPVGVAFDHLDLGFAHACGVSTTSELLCWGDDAEGQRDLEGSSGWTQVATGYQFTCGLDLTGEITCTGFPAEIQTPPVGPFQSISAGGVHACAVDFNQQVVCWGDPSIDLNTPPGAYARVAAGAYHTCVRDLFGETSCWGEGGFGQLHPPTQTYAVLVPGQAHTCGIDADGAVTCWGENSASQCDVPDFGAALPLDLALGDEHSCALLDDATVACWGGNSAGQADVPADLAAVQVDAGRTTNCAIDATNAVRCWGDDTYGLVADVPLGNDWSQVSVDEHHACAVAFDGAMVCWGVNLNNETLPPPGSWAQVSTGEDHTCGVTDGGLVECWGNDFQGQSSPADGDYRFVTAGRQHSCALLLDDTVACWGGNTTGGGRAIAPAGTFASISTSTDHTCGVRHDGTSLCWGTYTWGN
jgi:alpha-tubulin suppressor-like RCC1 family protein